MNGSDVFLVIGPELNLKILDIIDNAPDYPTEPFTQFGGPND